MSKQQGPVYHTGTINGICYYRLNGRYYARRKSTLSRKRVKRDPVFALTRKYAELLGQASRIAAGVYRLLPRDKKKLTLYRAMTGRAVALLKRGMQEAAIKEQLEQATRKGLKTAAVQQPVVRMRAKTGGMNVVRTVWGKKLPVGRQETGVWTVITRERVYQVRPPDVRCLSS